MSYCYEKGIPHSEFLKWSNEDRSKTLAYAMEQSLRCVSCGTASWEWDENRFAYTAVDDFCPGCYQKAQFQDGESRSLPGTSVKLIPTTPALKAKMQVAEMKRARMMRDNE
jgi:hypothetical protein